MEPSAPEEAVSPASGMSERKFVLILAIAAVVFAALPSLIALLRTPAGGAYLGFQYATDDHMVYSAWMRQAVEGRFLFDNRFTTDAQPGLTIHLYFLVLGWIAKITGIAVASNLARLVFSFLFVGLAYRLIRRLGWDPTPAKLALGLSVMGGGIGFFVWHTFGELIVTPSPLGGALLGRLPTDVWQPEGFVMSSMLTNGLFMVSLCLMLVVFGAYLDARESAKAVLPGALAIGVLMNIHSYDVLIIGLVMLAFAAASASRRQLTGAWVGRAVMITLGVVPAALWFVYVLKNDPVFQARAATETFSPNFRAVFFGYLPLVLLALVGIAKGNEVADRKRGLLGVMLYGLLLLGLFFMAASHLQPSYFLSMPVFAVVLVVAIAATALAAGDRPAWNLVVAWAFVGTIAIYFPGLFQRKLAMGLSIPWAILAGYGLYELLKGQERTIRLLATSVGVLLLSASGLRWFQRELLFIQSNCSRTSVQPVFLTADMQKILLALADTPGRRVVMAFPGIPSEAFRKNEQEVVTGPALSPIMPDLNAIATGLTGAYSYAGHWSETPNYNQKRGPASQIFLSQTPDEQRLGILREAGATHIITPTPESLPNDGIYDFRALGEVMVDGEQFRLIRLR
jgi:arabinosyltransferase C